MRVRKSLEVEINVDILGLSSIDAVYDLITSKLRGSG
jgi:hypothetical protein